MNINQFIALAPLTALAGTAIAVMIGIAAWRNFVLSCAIAAVGIVLSLAALGSVWPGTPVQASPLMLIDVYALFYIALLLSAGLAVLGFCYDYFKDRDGENEELPLLLLTALLGASVLAASTHFASFFIGLELLSISLFVLIGYPLNQAQALEAAIKYLILSGVSSAFLLMGIALIYAQSGELYFRGIEGYIASRDDINAMVFSGVLLVMAGLGFKLSLIPFHLWTPDVYQGAPAPISGFIATVSKGAVFVLLLRYFVSTDSYAYTPLLNVFSVMAALSILGGNLLALLQNNVKRLLAYSSIAHMGYLLVAFIAGGSVSSVLIVEPVAFYLLAYFITTIGAFGVVSVLSSPQAEADDLAFYRGLFWRRPWLAAIFTLMLLSLAGIPLTVGFIGKFYIFTGAADGGLWGLLLAVIVGSGLGLYYYLRIIVVMSMDAETVKTGFTQDWLSNVLLTVLTILLVWLGIYPSLLVNIIQSVSYDGMA
ncbi:NADH-quinone oxidoreductase subunit N [Candidatus Methylobacter oryzae]|uniref:NADH-quinone oxidoreductase subunit N n=1 Tax=Candidatus Methylobacter oryzae TaxID=2497749 RepID=A0ABY3CAD0_9GAMM|nr:NADH-quinone oxidoreductase subunit N [Candidatus Methylobacter oryzae]TRW94881.1 NADH-quinone oxidoreductase subunit N [Candidatus Methylobacter oryzae]